MVFQMFKNKNCLGIDVGTFSVKVVELSRSGGKREPVLENYGERVNDVNGDEVYKNIRRKNFILPVEEIAKSIKEVLKETGIKERKAIFSVPDFMSFFTVLKLPAMPKKEIASVVRFEARQHIPLPMEDVFLDWSILNEKEIDKNKKESPRILLVAVPKSSVSEFQELVKLAGLESISVEAGVFSLARSLVKGEDARKTVQIIDLGVQSTSISIVDGGVVKSTYNINFSDNEIIKNLASKLGVGYNEAEKIKAEKGLVNDTEVAENLKEQVDFLLFEGRKIAGEFFKEEEKEVDKIILSGGSSFTPGLKEYFEKNAEKETEIGNPFYGVSHPTALEDTLKMIGSRYAVAVGLAMRDFEE